MSYVSSKVIKKNQKELEEEQELQAYVTERNEKRKSLAKQVLIIVVCIGLVIAFCLPSIAALF